MAGFVGFLLIAFFLIVAIGGLIATALDLIGDLFHRFQKAVVPTLKGSRTRRSVEKGQTQTGAGSRLSVEKDPTLRDRNIEVFWSHRDAFNEFDNIDTRTRLCIADIAELEGCQGVTPLVDEQLPHWEARVPQEWIELRNYIADALHTKLDAITRRRAEQERKREEQERWQAEERLHELARLEAERAQAERLEAERYALWASNGDIIRKFLDIAERKVSIRDEYGDENWDVLPREIEKCLIKIARRQGMSLDEIQTAIDENRLPLLRGEYAWLKDSLDLKFREHHAALSERPASSFDFDKMSGEEFETWVGRLFEKDGFEVQGTRRTGDQGADLLATKDEKTIAIQAKCHKNAVGIKAVQEVIGALGYYGAHAGYVVTNSTFTRAAVALAQKKRH